jgi:hypothetical protein
MPRLTLIIIGLAALLVVFVTLTSRLLLPSALQMELQAAPDGSTPMTALPHLPALLDVRQAVELHLNPEWQVAIVSAAALEQLLSTFAGNGAATLQSAASTLQSGLDNDATLISALHRSGATLQVVSLKRNGLHLERYLDEVGQQLSTAGATVHSRGIDATLRTDRLPAARLHYSFSAGEANGQSAAVSGIQIATFDASASRLVIFTLTGQPSQQNELELLISDILAVATF